MDAIASNTHLPRRTAQRAVAELLDVGAIRQQRRGPLAGSALYRVGGRLIADSGEAPLVAPLHRQNVGEALAWEKAVSYFAEHGDANGVTNSAVAWVQRYRAVGEDPQAALARWARIENIPVKVKRLIHGAVVQRLSPSTTFEATAMFEFELQAGTRAS